MKSNILPFLLLFLSFAFGAFAQQPDRILSLQARVSLSTADPGQELYSVFGHSALRVVDPVLGFDKVYNYGTFDFETPGFYQKFLQGKLDYYLNPEPYRNFEYSYQVEERPIVESVLNLDSTNRQRIFGLLETNLLPENRAYKYDFFYDNCATRIRDIVSATYFNQIQWDSTQYLEEKSTMRQLLRPYMVDNQWTWFGMQLILGPTTDVRARVMDYQFLPDHVRTAFARTQTPDGQPLISDALEGSPVRGLAATQADWVRQNMPLFVTSALVLLWVLLRFAGFSSASTSLGRAVLLVFGLMGLLFLMMWVATDHLSTSRNLNMLWAVPTHLLMFWRKRSLAWVDYYFTAFGVLAGLFLALLPWLPQEIPMAAIPLIFLAALIGFFGK